MLGLKDKDEKYVLVFKSVDGTNITLYNNPRTLVSYGLELSNVHQKTHINTLTQLTGIFSVFLYSSCCTCAARAAQSGG